MYIRILLILLTFSFCQAKAINSNFIEFKKQDNFIKIIRVHNIDEFIKLKINKKNVYNWDLRILEHDRISADINNLINSNKNDLSNFKKIKNNSYFQIDKYGLVELIDNGFISTITNLKKNEISDLWFYDKRINKNYNIKFISKNYNSIIQNENIENVNFLDIFFSKKVNKSYEIINYHKSKLNLKIDDLIKMCDDCLSNNKINNTKSLELILIPKSYYIHFLSSFLSVFIFLLLTIYFFYEKFKK